MSKENVMNPSTASTPDSQRMPVSGYGRAAGNSNGAQPGDKGYVERRELQTSGSDAPSASSASSASDGPANAEQGRTLLPPVDIVEDETGITVWADLPGVPRDRLGIKVTGDNLVIEGASAVPVSADMELLYGEVQSPNYRRSFTLSRELDPGKIEAKLTNGVLRLRIPKAEEARPRRIEVSVG
jgi:HSP20 family protein